MMASREEKEKLLSEKMENIRKKNEELRKRHEEIEADKKNADKFSSTVTMVDKVKPYVMKAPRTRPEKSERPRESLEHPNIPRPSDIMPTRQRLSENDGPPPDPSYRFLSDPDRDGSDKEKKRDGRGKRKGKQGSKWGSSDGQEEEVEKVDGDGNMTNEFNDHGGQGNRGRTKSDQKFGRGRGSRGRGYGRPPHDQEHEYEEEFHRNDSFENHGGGGGGGGERNKPKSGLSFASRDIRYYPDENEDHRTGKDVRGRGRGRQNYSQWGHNNDNHPRSRRDHDSHGGRGRGRNDQQREYERWKAERAAIDEARLNRGKTDGGNWRREWDNDKINQGEIEEFGPVYDPRYPRSKNENFKLADLITFPNNDGTAAQPGQPQPQRKTQRERRKGNSQESREKFVKVDTQLVQKQLRLGGNDPKDTNWRSPPGSSQECQEVKSPDDVIVISDGCDEQSSSDDVVVLSDDMKEAPEEIATAHEASTERQKSDESMESPNECSHEDDPGGNACNDDHSDMKDKTDVQVPEEIATDHEIPSERQKSTESMESANESSHEGDPGGNTCNDDHSEMNDKINIQVADDDVPIATETEGNKKMVSVSQTATSDEPITDSSAVCDEPASSE